MFVKFVPFSCFDKVSFCALVALCAFAAQADITLDGVTEYKVDSGTNSVTEKVTGTGSIRKTGAGTLKLANASNDYSGGTLVEKGTLEVAAAGALGTGAVTNAADGAYFTFTAEPATSDGFVEHANDFVFTGTEADPGQNVIFYKNTKLTGDIVSSRRLRLRHNPKNIGSPGNGGPSTTFDGKIDLSSTYDLYLNLYGTMKANGPILVRNLYTGESWSGGGKLHLYSPETRIANTLEVGQPAITCYETNVLGYASVVEWRIPGGVGSGTFSLVDMNGKNQTIGSVSFLVQKNPGWDENRYKASASQLCFKSTDSATLTLTGNAADKTAYASIRGAISLVLDAKEHPGFVQTFAYSLSSFTGTTTVKAGTLKLTENARFSGTTAVTVDAGASFVSASTNSLPSLAAVKTLVVKGTLDASTARVNPFSGTLTSVELGADAVLKLPEGAQLKTASLKVGDQTYTAGTFLPSALPQLQGGSISVTGTAGSMTWTGAGADENLSTAGNWDATPDLVFGTKKAVFATGGTRAVVDTNALLGGIGFTAAGGFTLTRAAEPKALMLSGDITAAPGRYLVDTPLTVLGDHTVNTTGGGAITLKNVFPADASMPGQLTLVSQNIRLEGTNVVAGGVVMTTNRVTVAGLLATPGHAYEGRPESTAGAFYINLASTKDGDKDRTGLCLSNAVVEKAVYVNNVIGTTAIYAPAGTTNEIKGFFRYVGDSHWEKFMLLQKSELTLSGGLETIHSFRVFEGGTLRIKNRPGSFLGSAGLNPQQGTVSLDVANNVFKYLCIGYNAGYTAKVETTVDYAVTNGLVQVGGSGGSVDSCKAQTSGTYTLDLHGTRQRCQKLGVLTKGILTGTYPAMLEVTEGRMASDPEGYAVNGQVTGGVGLHLSGAGTLAFKKAFASAGDLEVSNGTMSFAAGASWKNGTNVTVRGTGIFQVADANALGHQARLVLADSGKLSIPSGVTLAVKTAKLNGTDVDPGTYTASDELLKDIITGGGSLRVRGVGAILLVR